MTLEWQMTGEDEWEFGEKIRGIVRHVQAEIYFDEDSNHPEGGWNWSVTRKAWNRNGVESQKGHAVSLIQAVKICERALGIVSSHSWASDASALIELWQKGECTADHWQAVAMVFIREVAGE